MNLLLMTLWKYKKGSDLGRLGQFTLWTAESYTVTLSAIEKKLQKYYQDKGFYPDMLIIDYPELLKNDYINSGVREEHATEMLTHSIRDLAKNIIWFLSLLVKQTDSLIVK